MEISHFGIFVIATLILNITPGNDFIYVATRSLSKGTKAGIISSFGISMGLMVHVSASVLGLSLLLSKSIIAFEVIKWLGAAYLIFLGIRSILSKSHSLNELKDKKEISVLRLLRQGFFTNVFNPKVALFFLSFLPQFADSSSPNFSLQLLILGGWFIFSGTIVSICIALTFSRMRSWLKNFKLYWKIQQKIAGFVFIGLGLSIAFSKEQ